MTSKTNTRAVPRDSYRNYLVKSEQFMESMLEALMTKKWNSVGLNAVHAAISANDALCTYYLGKRSANEKHHDAIILLLSVFPDEETKRNSHHLLWLIGRKNLIEYEARLFLQTEAYEAAKHAERFIDWIRIKLPK